MVSKKDRGFLTHCYLTPQDWGNLGGSMSDSIIQGKWDEFKGEVQRLWGEISGDDLERTKGNVKSIGGLLEQKYGKKKEEYRQKFDDLVSRYSDRAADATQGVKERMQEDRDSEIRH